MNRKATILVIDDDDTIRKIISKGLEKAGYEVVAAESGNAALERITEAIPDLIISDITMPDMDGMALLNKLRTDKATRGIPVIMVTALGSTDSVVAGLNLGADDYLVKPFVINELLARVRSKIERPPIPSEFLIRDRQTGLLNERIFREEVEREVIRSKRGGATGCLALLSLAEWENLQQRLGTRAESEISKQLSNVLTVNQRPLDLIGLGSTPGTFGLLLPETTPETAKRHLDLLSQNTVQHTFIAAGEHLHLTPAFGFTTFTNDSSFESLWDQARTALDVAVTHRDLLSRRYEPEMGSFSIRKEIVQTSTKARFQQLMERLNLPWQIVFTFIAGWVVPFFIYKFFDSVGYDITYAIYIIMVFALTITAFFIWVEGFLSLKLIDPPSDLKTAYPPASAIIAAYLPNEAATIVETVEAFLRIEYPAPLQIILAYNTPYDLPVENILREIARKDARFLPLRIPNSTSKAQNVNTALAEVSGEFVGIFDADHQPAVNSFIRAWRWLAEGYDVVQGHCVVRNGDVSWVSRTVAVEFESIYGNSHPGRMRLHNFGIFGGSNGFWRTALLRQTRMHGFMLTEDIDSSIRILESGSKIISDPQLLSRELAPTTIPALWNQRMRWAQGWYQVSIKHLIRGLRSKHLSARQKFGVFWLLGWREIYPWISIQMVPLITYWVVKYGGLEKLNWVIPIFILTSLFTLSVGPGQAFFAYKISVPEIKKNKIWFVYYLIITSLFYSEFKNLIARVAQVKELIHERHWKVTPRETKNTD
jgi:CheY-like chemotaxis protein/cellulose synthase/poly-beta-1,6-N-acetylglucosamine synthase-like glycosyltransferase